MKLLFLSNDLGMVRSWNQKKAFGGVRLELGEYVPDSGQEHTADSDNGFFVTTTSFDSAVTVFAFGVFVGFDDSVGHLNQKGFEVSTDAGDAGGFALAAALVVARATASPRTEVFSRWEHGHISTDFGTAIAVIGSEERPGTVRISSRSI